VRGRIRPLESMGREQPTAYEYATSLWLPILLTAATIVAQFWGKSGVLVLILGASAVVAFVVLIVRMQKRIKAQKHKRVYQQIAANFYPRFQKEVNQLGKFVNTQTNDTLHMLLNDVSMPLQGELSKRLGTSPLAMWYYFWHYFKQRVDRTEPTYAELVAGVQEFNFLLATYNGQCVLPIFKHLPNDVRSKLTEQERSRLNGFQQRFTLYLKDYMAFAEELSQALPELNHLPRYVENSDPL
jgi:hypothetical protein